MSFKLCPKILANGRSPLLLVLSVIVLILEIELLVITEVEINTMKTIGVVFGFVLLVSLIFYIFGWSFTFYEEIQLGLLVLGMVFGANLIVRRPTSSKKTTIVILGLLVGNWGILSNFFQTIYWMVFGFV